MGVQSEEKCGAKNKELNTALNDFVRHYDEGGREGPVPRALGHGAQGGVQCGVLQRGQHRRSCRWFRNTAPTPASWNPSRGLRRWEGMGRSARSF